MSERRPPAGRSARGASAQARRARRSQILLALYLASVALVCSFILFEVLDIDGSDFSPLPASVEARPAELHHNSELKRAILAVALTLTPGALPVLVRELGRTVRVERPPVRPVAAFTPSLTSRVLLPRAVLGDGSPA